MNHLNFSTILIDLLESFILTNVESLVVLNENFVMGVPRIRQVIFLIGKNFNYFLIQFKRLKSEMIPAKSTDISDDFSCTVTMRFPLVQKTQKVLV